MTRFAIVCLTEIKVLDYILAADFIMARKIAESMYPGMDTAICYAEDDSYL
jgi:hypothetical protein